MYLVNKEGAKKLAFNCIVGSGPNSNIMDWSCSHRVPTEKELVLLDCGAMKNNYASDNTRTFPVGRRFTAK